MKELRCKYCNRLLMKIKYGEGQIKCMRCNRLVNFKVKDDTLDKIVEKLKNRQEKQ